MQTEPVKGSGPCNCKVLLGRFSELLLPVHETLHVVGGGSSRSMWPLSDLGNTCVQAKNVGGLESSAVVSVWGAVGWALNQCG